MRSKELICKYAEEIVGKALQFVLANGLISDEIMNVVNVSKIIDQYKETFAYAKSNSLNNAYLFVLNQPQVYDIFESYLEYVYLQEFMGISADENIPEEEIVNFIVKVSERNPETNNEESAYFFRSFFSILVNLFYTNSIIKKLKESQMIIKNINQDVFTRLKCQIDCILKKSYIPENKGYIECKQSCNKTLKRNEKKGHIYFLDEFDFNRFYVPAMLSKFWNSAFEDDKFNLISKFDTVRWMNIFSGNNIIYIVGGAGYGKSLFLKNLIINTEKLQIKNVNDYLIIPCDLKSYYRGDMGDTKPVISFFVESMISSLGIEDITKEFIQYWLSLGRCLILLDALDEVPKINRETLHKKIINYISFNYPNNKVCITSRSRFFVPQENIEVFKIQPLSEEDIKLYIDNMVSLKAFKKENKVDFLSQAKALIDKHFLNSFLVLSLLVNIYKAENRLPENKVDLYKKCFTYIAKERELKEKKTGREWKNVDVIMKDSTFISLSKLAAPNNKDIPRDKINDLLMGLYKYKFNNDDECEEAINSFLEFCSTRTEFFVPSAQEDNFRFFHRSFFEYFYTRYILRESDVKTIYRLMTQFDVDSEVFELVVAILKEENEEKYQALLKFVFSETERAFQMNTNNLIAFFILSLSMQVVNDRYFLEKYYFLTINYHDQLVSSEIDPSIDKSITLWIKRVMYDENKKREFLSLYELDCVRYIILRFNNYDGFIDFFNSEGFAIDYKVQRSFFQRIIHYAPYYVRIYCEYDNIFTLLNKYSALGFKRLWETVKPEEKYPGMNKSMKKKFRNGYNNFLVLKKNVDIESFS